LIGDKEHEGGQTGQHGIFIENCGFAQTTGLTSGTYSRYDSSTVGIDKLNKIGVCIENCIIEDCLQYGIRLNTSSNNTITGNTVQNNSSEGIRLSPSSNNTITGNTIQNNGSQGIYLTSSSRNCITNNIVYQNNDVGIQLNSTGNDYNNIYGNISQSNTGGNYSSGGGTGNQIWADMNIY
ncbi:MAG TPA: right-handed parallel beta-helix repeat-containing protein, partial [Tissierellaceae bacterium]|nr:right-handed parallel beta-helix repeat-containing protein [Tissierellaceae bacterium]